MGKRQTIGDHPLDAFISPKQESKNKSFPEFEKSKKLKKQRMTVQISEDIIDRLKNAVYWTPGLTLASLAEEAFTKIVDNLERKNGKSFQERKSELKTGRPLK